MVQSPPKLALGAKSDTGTFIETEIGKRSLISDYWELTKPRLSLLSVITAIVGYLAARPLNHDISILVFLSIGTSLAAGGAAVLNQWLEREVDKLMPRTRSRPLPMGVISPDMAFIYGICLCFVGDFLLWTQVNHLASLLAFLTQVCYLWAYTPLKRVTHWNTEIGAIPGAIPPLIGWAAAEPTTWALGWVLFAILMTWQIPHFMAISWMYRRDYANAGFKMLAVVEPTGTAVSREAVIFATLLLGCSILPYFFGAASIYYLIVSAALGLWFLNKSIKFLYVENRDKSARSLFIASIIYLPVLLAALVIDRWFIM